ncbi:MAG: hypothetical protein IPN67_04825 [Bacteroidales bacterium]|nr:hypothetical protein [Bacteroidales bacterium]
MSRPDQVNIRIFLFIVLTSGVLTGCVKTEGTIKIKGKVSDERTKTGILFKNIIVQGLVTSDNESETIEAGQFSTDSSGRFTYSLKKIKGAYRYNFCFIGNPDYAVTVSRISLGEIERNAKYLFFNLDKLADLTITINRKSKIPASDTLHLCWESDGVFGLSLYPYTVNNNGQTNNSFGLTSARDLWWTGGYVNSTINTKVFADKKTELSWELYRSGKREEFIDTITCKRDFANTVYFTY